MRLGVNARRLSGQRLGIGRYIEYMAKNWAAMLDGNDQVALYVQEPVDIATLPRSAQFRVRSLPPKLTGLLWENLVLARHAHEMDVLFCPSYTAPLPFHGRCVVAIHSLNEAQSGTHQWWYPFAYTPWYRSSAHKAEVVIAPSESVKSDMVQHYGVSPDKVEVVPLGVDESFQPIEDGEALRATRQRYLGADRPYIVFVDKLSQRRNIPLLLEAFALLKARHRIPHSLLLFGPNYLHLPLDQWTRRWKIADSVVQTDGNVASHRELVLVYNAADLYVLPASYEGFSLPILEAMSCGIPVVTTNRGAIPEIARGSAVLINELVAEVLAEAMWRALTDRALRQHLRAAGLERVRAYRWETTARRTLGILRRVGGNGAGIS